jgi:hypothetical protein
LLDDASGDDDDDADDNDEDEDDNDEVFAGCHPSEIATAVLHYRRFSVRLSWIHIFKWSSKFSATIPARARERKRALLAADHFNAGIDRI